MGFMVPVAEHMVMYHVETNYGTEYVPEEVCGVLMTCTPSGIVADGELDSLSDYVEGSEIRAAVRNEGWYSRLTAPGYLDSTEWEGPYATSEEAIDGCKEQYDVDDNGDMVEEG